MRGESAAVAPRMIHFPLSGWVRYFTRQVSVRVMMQLRQSTLHVQHVLALCTCPREEVDLSDILQRVEVRLFTYLLHGSVDVEEPVQVARPLSPKTKWDLVSRLAVTGLHGPHWDQPGFLAMHSFSLGLMPGHQGTEASSSG